MQERTTSRVSRAIALLGSFAVLYGCALEPQGSLPPTTQAPNSGGGGEGGLDSNGELGGGGGSAGAGGAAIVCGDGIVDTTEACDDGNDSGSDGCASCTVEIGFKCKGEPSVCEQIPAQSVTVDLPNGELIPDGEYDGTINTMGCVIVTIPDEGWTSVQHVEVSLSIDHTFVGDLIIKMKSPIGTLTTLMNRPGSQEPKDAAYESPNGDDSNLIPDYPIVFRDGEKISAESMGSTIGTGEIVCKDDQICAYNPARGLGEGKSGLADFKGENPVGNWIVCVGDGDNNDVGTIRSVLLNVLSY